MTFDPENYFTGEAQQILRHHIVANDGNEVLFIGSVNDDGIVCDARVVAMGNETAVVNVRKIARPGDVMIHNHPSGDIHPSNADLAVSARGAEHGVGSYIVDNDVLKVLPVVRHIPPEDQDVNDIEDAEVLSVLGSDGVLSTLFPGFEFRDPQLTMAKTVASAINEGVLLSVEAGTGTGKSFAYLVPLILYVTKNRGKKAVVSTSTIALEEQLKDKDIPVLLEYLDKEELPVAILRGRSNYICLRRYENYRTGSMMLPFGDGSDRESAVSDIDAWMELPHDGSRTSMTCDIDRRIWNEIRCEETSCERSRCRFFDRCYFFRARRKVNFASLILVNHHLLMADVSVRMENEEETGILPEYDILVIDEAHNLFNSAVSFLGESTGLFGIRYTVSRLLSREGNSGLLSKLHDIAGSLSASVLERTESVINRISVFNASFTHIYMPEILDWFSGDEGVRENTFELDDIHSRREIGTRAEKVTVFLDELVRDLESLLASLKTFVVTDPYERDRNGDLLYSLFTDISGVFSKIDAEGRFLKRFFSDEDTDNAVFWALRRRRDDMIFSITPIEIQRILSDHLYKKTDAVVFSSASLATSRNPRRGFDFFARESGLDLCDRKREFVMLPGCFDYARQLRAFTANDLPSPNTGRFDTAAVETAGELISASRGGALLLFTSIRHREMAYEMLQDTEHPVLNQGAGSLRTVVDDFRSNVSSSLLATDTFWEGMDMKGETLRNLVIIRLPFRFPSHPFIKRYIARLEERTGKSGFMLYTLPTAVLKMKQGVGRLIRSRRDRGTITILDKRIVTKRYGRQFMDALPVDVRFNALPTRLLIDRVREFFSG